MAGSLEHHFERFASRVSRWAGHSLAFFAAIVIVVGWAVSGPLFGFSDTWQLVINTGTTVLTFLMVFLIQNTMNRDSAALHLKLDELISVTSQARDALIGAERLDEDQDPRARERRPDRRVSRSASGSDGENQRERLDRELIELLNELRVVLTGVQVLFAFLLILPFTDRFQELLPTQQLMFAVAFTVTAMASVLLMAPTAYHRIRFRQQDKERMLRWANRFTITGVGLLAIAIGTIVLLVIDVIYELRAAAAVAGAVTALIAWAWFALPLSRRVADDRSD